MSERYPVLCAACRDARYPAGGVEEKLIGFLGTLSCDDCRRRFPAEKVHMMNPTLEEEEIRFA